MRRGSRPPLVPFAACLAALGCGHAHVAADAPPPAAPEERAEASVTKPRASTADAATGPPLFSSPAAALAPDALAKIQAKLVANGDLADGDATGRLDAPTKRALAAVQRKRNLPATGVPDDVTVRALGLDPGTIFRGAPK